MLTEEAISNLKKAGNIAAQARDYGASMIKPGASVLEVTEAVEKKIVELGGGFAFPTQISLNDVAAHYCADPDDKLIFKEGDIAKIDVGVHIDGYIGDTAVTVDLGTNPDLVNASHEALAAAIMIAKPGVTLGQLGRAIDAAIRKRGMTPVINLSGHGLDQYVFHGSPSIPNVDTGDRTKLEKGMVIAIEPFATPGKGLIYESGNANIFSQVSEKPVRNMITRDVMKEISKYRMLPFTTRWLVRKFPLYKVNFALKELMNMDIIRSYPPLPERTHAFVSQAEHTLIVDDEPIVTTRL